MAKKPKNSEWGNFGTSKIHPTHGECKHWKRGDQDFQKEAAKVLHISRVKNCLSVAPAPIMSDEKTVNRSMFRSSEQVDGLR